MSRYVDTEKIKYSYLPLAVMPDVFVTKKEIDEMPSEDVAPVVHAHWIVIETGYLTCSHCNRSLYVGGDVKAHTIAIAESGEFEFCPKCGAKMNED